MQNLGLNKEENDTLLRFQPPIPELESKATVTIIVCGLYYYFTSNINNNIDQFPNNTAHSVSHCLSLCVCVENTTWIVCLCRYHRLLCLPLFPTFR